MNSTVQVRSPEGRLLEIRTLDPEFWTHSSPLEVGTYFKEQNQHLSNSIDNGDLVYHYTTLTGLAGIVQSSTIWASDVRMMNDRSEISFALDLMRNAVANDVGHLMEPALDEIFGSGRFWQFATCFSRSRDQLSQWRAYGAEVGISIGFDREHLSWAAKRHTGEMKPCVYMEASDLASIAGEMSSLSESMKDLAHYDSEGLIVDKDWAKGLQQRVLRIASFIKHSSFKEENEIRLLKSVSRLSDEVYFRSSSRDLVPYTKIEIDTRKAKSSKRALFANHLGMMEVVVWPADVDDQILDAIDMLLDPVGGVLVRRSASPYRV